ncbi:MAG: hypothetical protein IT320_19705, partial [Anaerolineae bacterium]|nr:hypothetical protein [Anaerolineae bacterium]
MKTSIRLITFLLLVTLIVGVAAAQDVTFVQKDPFIIGYSVYDMQQPYWQEYARGVQEASEDAGAQFVLSDQKSSQETQVSGSL